MTFRDYLKQQQTIIDAELGRLVPPEDTAPATIHRAMRYSLFAGGKRIRPILCLAAAHAVSDDAPGAGRAACALEMVHTYSLIHDDLPALDNDDFRRGRPTCHKQFSEAMAILAGDALLTLAFQVLGDIRLVQELAKAAGTVGGMIGGQVADLEATAVIPSPAEGEGSGRGLDRSLRPDPSLRLGMTQVDHLRFIHENKTGKLLTASAVLGGILAGANEEKISALRRYGRAVGLAFQIVDDLLDQEESAATLGKTAGKDLAQGKLTYPAVVGVEAARAEAGSLLREAEENAGIIAGPVNYLAGIARYICERRS
ncbi:MAG: polyprenyl synthetase family protein [Thermoanaerobaculia bacterium]